MSPSGGAGVARALADHGVRFLFTLCGGHISPILVESKRLGVRVVDVRHEASAVFAADAVARLSGVPGVAAVTAGPGVTNTITALKNAQMAQSPLVLLGGATPTVLKGRGSLQDIDQLSVVRSLVKRSWSVRRARDAGPAVREALAVAASGVPGAVFVELPVDLLYPEEVVRSWYRAKTEGEPRNLRERAQQLYLRRHLERMFAPATSEPSAAPPAAPEPGLEAERRVRAALARAERPVLVIGSQALGGPADVTALAEAVGRLGVPVYLGGMARGLLGRDHPLQLRHHRKQALRAADLVVLAGFPCDFRLDYGAQIRGKATLVGIHRSRADLMLNRRPTIPLLADPGRFLCRLAAQPGPPAERWAGWLGELRERDAGREAEIAAGEGSPAAGLDPVALCRQIEAALPDDSVLVADGGDFVATASYVLRPRGPLRWLDPGAFGTLGVGGGFALGAKLCRPEAEVWLLYGDGSAGYSLAEIDSCVRHGLPVIAVVGNDAAWSQIAREQVEILGDDVATNLAFTDYHRVAEGWGGVGIRIERADEVGPALAAARAAVAAGKPVVLNAILAKSDFRKGSISM